MNPENILFYSDDPNVMNSVQDANSLADTGLFYVDICRPVESSLGRLTIGQITNNGGFDKYRQKMSEIVRRNEQPWFMYPNEEGLGVYLPIVAMKFLDWDELDTGEKVMIINVYFSFEVFEESFEEGEN